MLSFGVICIHSVAQCQYPLSAPEEKKQKVQLKYEVKVLLLGFDHSANKYLEKPIAYRQ